MEKIYLAHRDGKTISMTQLPDKKFALPSHKVGKNETALGTALKALDHPSYLDTKVKCVGHLTDTSANISRVYYINSTCNKNSVHVTQDKLKELIASNKVETESKELLEMFWRQIWS